MKKLGIIILVILIFAVGGLWILGAPKIPTYEYHTPLLSAKNAALALQPVKRPLEDKNDNGIADWEDELFGNVATETPLVSNDQQAATLVIKALKKKQTPLLPLETLPVTPVKIYQLSDLKLANQVNESAIAEYGQALVQIMSVFSAPGLGNELNLVLEGTEKDRPQAPMKIAKAAKRYNTVVDQLLAMTVPANAGPIHLNLINGLTRLAENAWLMTKINEEPIVALGAAQLQTSRLRQMLSAIGNVNLFFTGYDLNTDRELAKADITIDF